MRRLVKALQKPCLFHHVAGRDKLVDVMHGIVLWRVFKDCT